MSKKHKKHKKYKFGIENNPRPSEGKDLSRWDEEEYDDDYFDEEDDDCAMYDTDSFSQDAMSDFMTNMIEAANHQMTLTNELTKIVVGKSAKEMGADEIFAVFKKAAMIVAETSPLKELMAKPPTK